jgi:VanZ family protein
MAIKQIFTPASPYKKQAKIIAIIWTILIFIGCFTPGRELPKVDVPLIDKWVHIVLFGGFTFLWLCTNPTRKPMALLRLLVIAILLGAFIEVMQGILTFLGRSMEFMDAVADSIGGFVGITIFYII